MRRGKVGLAITYGLKHNLLNLAFKLFLIMVPTSFAALPPSSVSSINHTACLDYLQNTPCFPATPEVYLHSSPALSLTALPLSLRQNINAAVWSLPYPTSVCPWTHFTHFWFHGLASVLCASLIHGLLPHSLYKRVVKCSRQSTNACQTWLFLGQVPLIICWWSPQKHDYNKDKWKKEAPKCTINPTFHPVL